MPYSSLDDAPNLPTKELVDWWNATNDEELHQKTLAWYQKLRNDDVGRLELIKRHMLMYGNNPVTSLGLVKPVMGMSDGRIKLNVIKACSDTVTAKITKNKPRPKPLTSGGNWSLRRKAKFLETFFDAQFYIS